MTMKINSTLLKYFTLILIFTAPLSSFAETSYKGKVVYNNENRTPIKGVEVFLKNTDGVIVASVFTDEDGLYEFDDIEEAVYIVDGRYDGEAGGVDFQDLYLILKHLTGEVQLEGISYLACDVDGSGVIDWNDYWHFMIDWFINGDEFLGGEWVFLAREIDLTGIAMKSAQDDLMSSHGDGDGDYEPGVIIKNLHINPELIYAGTIPTSSNNFYEIPIKYTGIESVGGFALVFNYSENVIIEDITSDIDNLNYSFENGMLRVSWMNSGNISAFGSDAPLFTLKTRVLKAETEKQILSVSNESHLIDLNGARIEGAKLSMPKFINQVENVESELKGVYPNPVRNNARIEYILASESDVCLTLYNLNGQKITELVKAVQPSGAHFVNLNVDHLNLTNGTYVYRLDCIGEQNYSESKLLIVCK